MITRLTPVPTMQTSPGISGPKQSLGKQDFMKLLIAQLKAQDPTNPMDAQDFSAQLAQFSSLEQMIAINGNLEGIRKGQTTLTNSSAINLIGKTVNSPGNIIEFSPGENQALGYSLAEDAASVSIDIFNSAGQKIATLNPGSQSKGVNQVQWSGADREGHVVDEGTYTFLVQAADEEGNIVSAETFSSGVVTDVVFEDGASFAIVNGSRIPAGKISRVGAN
ncbi:MAG: flagellar hook assembly protein FlgD [Nitrospinales bacterium]